MRLLDVAAPTIAESGSNLLLIGAVLVVGAVIVFLVIKNKKVNV